MAAITRLIVTHDTNDVAQGWADALAVEASQTSEFCNNVAARLFERFAMGARHGLVYFEQESGTTLTGAAITITPSQPDAVDGDTITFGGRVLTAKTSPVGENQFAIGATTAAFRANLTAAINNHSELKGILSATNNTGAGTVTVTCLLPGLIGKHITVATSNATAFAFTGTTLTLSTSPTVLTTARVHRAGL